MIKRFDIVVTVGPALFPRDCLERVSALGATILRLNGAHLDWDMAPALIADLRRRVKGVRVMLDVSGRKVRLCRIPQPIAFRCGDTLRFGRHQINFPQVFDQVRQGAQATAVDGLVQLDVTSVSHDVIEFVARTDGTLQNGKGLHFADVKLTLPPTSTLEEEQIRRLNMHVDLFGLSFVHNAADIDYFQRIIGDRNTARIIPKIETRQALANRDAIVRRSTLVLIDRGDLASEIGMHGAFDAVRQIIATAKRHRKRVIVATHFLRSMAHNPAPTMSEYFDLHFVLSLGVHGIQFSDETAVGQHPEACMKLLREAMIARLGTPRRDPRNATRVRRGRLGRGLPGAARTR
jgi:pyruvate kinase